MQFDSWAQFWSMNGYGLFVWLSFGVSTLVIVLSIVISRYNRNNIFHSIQQEKWRKQRILQAKQNQAKVVTPEGENRSL